MRRPCSASKDACRVLGRSLVHFLRYRNIHLCCGPNDLLAQSFGWDGRPTWGVRLCPYTYLADLDEEEKETYIVARLRKLGPDELKETALARFSDHAWEEMSPALYEYMTTTEYPDGTPRKPSSVTLFVADGVLKCVLKDADNRRALWCSGETWDDLWSALEELLDAPDAIWRVDRENGAGEASRIKKK